MIYQAEQWPHGLRCAACLREFVEGQPICQRLEAMTEFEGAPAPILLIVCADCDITGRLVPSEADSRDNA